MLPSISHRYEYNPATDICYCNLGFMGYPHYRVGDDGTVWSLYVRRGYGGGYLLGRKWTPLLAKRKEPHSRVKLKNEQGVLRIQVHRLVLLAFVGPPPANTECCHFPDPNTNNNKLNNLRWDTRKGNCKDRSTHGRTFIARGEKNSQCKTPDAIALNVKRLFASGTKIKTIAATHGLPYGRVYDIIHRNWKHLRAEEGG